MVATPKALLTVGGFGGGATVRLAVLLGAPGPLSLAEIGPVVLLNVPVAVACTFREIKHAPSAMGCNSDILLIDAARRGISWTAGPSEPPVRVIEVEPGVAVNVPPQSLLTFGIAATCKPAGSASVNEMPVRATSLLGGVELLLLLLIVKLTNDVPPCTVLLGTNDLLIVGGKATNKVAEPPPPVPPLVELTGPVVFR